MGKNEIDETDLLRFDLYRNMRQIIREFDSFREGIARNFDLSGASLYLLLSIGNTPDCSYKELASYTGMAPNTVSSVLNSLVNKKLVYTVPDVTDRRIVRITLSSEGCVVHNQAWQLIHTDSYAEENLECTKRFFQQIKQLRTYVENI